MKSLESVSFLNLYDRVSDNAKVEIMDELINRLSLEELLGNKHVLDKMKLEARFNFENDQVRTLFMNSNVSSFIRDCYDTSGYAQDVNQCVTKHMKNWNYYFVTDSGNYIIFESLELFEANYNDKPKYEVKLFTFDVISKINSDQIFKLQMFHRVTLVEWYAI